MTDLKIVIVTSARVREILDRIIADAKADHCFVLAVTAQTGGEIAMVGGDEKDEEGVLPLLVFWEDNKSLLQEWKNKWAPIFRIAWNDGARHIDVKIYPTKGSKEHICHKLAWPWGRPLTAREVRAGKVDGTVTREILRQRKRSGKRTQMSVKRAS